MKVFALWKKIVTHPEILPLLVVLLLGYLSVKPLFSSGYFNMHDDLQMMRQLEMEKCFLDGQIPCRWVPDMGYGYGFPLFNFYPPLPYLVGQIIRVVGFSFADTAKGLFIIALMGSGVTMYALARAFFDKKGSVLAAVFYIWAPYHSVDVYVRGALNEAWALIWFPIILLLIYKLIVVPKVVLRSGGRLNHILLLSLSLFCLLTSHNLMAMIFAPVAAVWSLIWIIKTKNWRSIVDLGVSGIWAVGLAAFFTLPVVLEQKLVHADTLVAGYYEYTAHFATISQILFSRFWGYGPSVWMDADDKMSFQIGHLHWILSIIVFILYIYSLAKNKFKNPSSYILATIYFITVGWLAAFMIHSKSTPIWTILPSLKFVQFPWRFLTIVILCFSFAIGAIPMLLTRITVHRWLITLFLIFAVVFLGKDYFVPERGKLGPLTDQEKFSGAAWDLQRTAGIYDYLPKTAKQNPRDGQSILAEVIEGNGQVLNQKQGTNWASFDVAANGEQSGTTKIRINIYEFPNWKVYIDGSEVNQYIADDEMWGRMYVDVPGGNHKVYLKLYDTPIRSVGNIISVFAWGMIALILLFKRYKIGLSP